MYHLSCYWCGPLDSKSQGNSGKWCKIHDSEPFQEVRKVLIHQLPRGLEGCFLGMIILWNFGLPHIQSRLSPMGAGSRTPLSTKIEISATVSYGAKEYGQGPESTCYKSYPKEKKPGESKNLKMHDQLFTQPVWKNETAPKQPNNQIHSSTVKTGKNRSSRKGKITMGKAYENKLRIQLGFGLWKGGE